MSEEVILLQVVCNKIFKILKSRKNKNRAPQARDFCLVIAENAKNKFCCAEGAKYSRFSLRVVGQRSLTCTRCLGVQQLSYELFATTIIDFYYLNVVVKK